MAGKEFFGNLGDTLKAKSKEAAEKAKDMAEIAKLKSQISTCEETIKKNYSEIGKLYFEALDGEAADEENPYAKQIEAIRNAMAAVDELQEQIRLIKEN